MEFLIFDTLSCHLYISENILYICYALKINVYIKSEGKENNNQNTVILQYVTSCTQMLRGMSLRLVQNQNSNEQKIYKV